MVMKDKNLLKWMLAFVLVPFIMLFFMDSRFRYPCQNPDNWETIECQRPLCDVTRSCPDHIFKGQRDPRIGPDAVQQPQGVICGK